jgi:hypothetical protein
MPQWKIVTCVPTFFVLFMARRSWNSLDWIVPGACWKRAGAGNGKPELKARIRPMLAGWHEVQHLALPGIEVMHSFPTRFPQISR